MRIADVAPGIESKYLSIHAVKTSVMVTLALMMLSGVALAVEPLDKQIKLNIEANTRLEDALIQWGTVAGVTVMINSADIPQRLTSGVHGVLSARTALSQILRGSGLSYTEVGGRVRIVPTGELVRSWYSEDPAAEGANPGISDHSDAISHEDATQGSNGRVGVHGADISEVVVTAQKREQKLADVPVPISVVDTQGLAESNLVKLQDYYSSVPGLTVNPAPQSSQIITIRGITTGGQNNGLPTVGVMIDDVPLGGGTTLVVPDLDPGDLSRIEVLRGPQGTLYGASSLGGLLKFVTVDPTPASETGRVEVGTSDVYHGSDLGYNVRASGNLPLSSVTAIRASAFVRDDPGYIDDPVVGVDGINRAHAYGGHLAFMWKPSEELSLKLSALYQQIKGNGADLVLLGAGLPNLEQQFIRGTGAYDREVQAYSAILTYNFGKMQLTSLTGYNVNSYHDSADFSNFFGGVGGLFDSPPLDTPPFGVTGSAIGEGARTAAVTQEFRLSAQIAQWLDGLGGLFYSHARTTYWQSINGVDPATGETVGSGVYIPFPSSYEETAAFINFTFHATDKFDVQVGGRGSQVKQAYIIDFFGPLTYLFAGTPPGTLSEIGTEEHSKASAFTYLLTPSYKISPDVMVYARLASGYRPGGPNAVVVGVPPGYQADKTKNYELGVKADTLDHKLSVDASLYYIDWKNIQISLVTTGAGGAPGVNYTGNAGAARSKGAELSLTARPMSGLTLSAWTSWIDAQVTEAFQAGVVPGNPGDRLPYSAKFSANASIDEEFPLGRSLTGDVGASGSYVGDRLSDLTLAPQPRIDLGSYAMVNVHTGIHYNNWAVNLYCNNATDRRGLLNVITVPVVAATYLTPRTIGVSLTGTF